MIIPEKSFHTSINSLSPDLTMLKFPNVVDSVDLAEIIVFSTYQFNSKSEIDRLVSMFKHYKPKKVLIDFSRELFSGELMHRLLLEESLENVVIYTNEAPPDVRGFGILKKKGCEIVNVPFFLKYIDYYTPVLSDVELDFRNFLLYVGKLKIDRVALVGLLSYYNLLEYGYVSYITGKNNFAPEKPSDYFESNSPIEQKAKVEAGLSKLDSDLILDVEKLTHKISHSRKYHADYYHNVDFVVVCESDTTRPVNFITEKTGKCIQQNKKFILLGSHGLLSYIRQEAKTHLNKDISPLIDWCDTSYDKIPNLWDRVDKIVEIIQHEIDIRKTK